MGNRLPRLAGAAQLGPRLIWGRFHGELSIPASSCLVPALFLLDDMPNYCRCPIADKKPARTWAGVGQVPGGSAGVGRGRCGLAVLAGAAAPRTSHSPPLGRLHRLESKPRAGPKALKSPKSSQAGRPVGVGESASAHRLLTPDLKISSNIRLPELGHHRPTFSDICRFLHHFLSSLITGPYSRPYSQTTFSDPKQRGRYDFSTFLTSKCLPHSQTRPLLYSATLRDRWTWVCR